MLFLLLVNLFVGNIVLRVFFVRFRKQIQKECLTGFASVHRPVRSVKPTDNHFASQAGTRRRGVGLGSATGSRL